MHDIGKKAARVQGIAAEERLTLNTIEIAVYHQLLLNQRNIGLFKSNLTKHYGQIVWPVDLGNIYVNARRPNNSSKIIRGNKAKSY